MQLQTFFLEVTRVDRQPLLTAVIYIDSHTVLPLFFTI